MQDLTTHHRHSWQPRKSRLIERIKPWAAALFIVLAYGIVGTLDYEAEVAMEEARTTQPATNL